MAAPNPKETSLFPILLVNFIGTLGYSIVLPFLVAVVTKFGGNAVVYGIVGATYSAFQLVGARCSGNGRTSMGGEKCSCSVSWEHWSLGWYFLRRFFFPRHNCSPGTCWTVSL
jgi:hypothetical protein